MSRSGHVFTVGHGNRSTDELVAVLGGAGVGRLVDVRRFPASRHNPHLSREALAPALEQHGIAYFWRGEELGGRRKSKGPSRHPAWTVPGFRAYADFMGTQTFRRALSDLRREAGFDPPLALMCAETLWWKCHRQLIADALAMDDFEVVHLLGAGKTQVHVLHPALRIDDHGRPVYDRGETPDLFR